MYVHNLLINNEHWLQPFIKVKLNQALPTYLRDVKPNHTHFNQVFLIFSFRLAFSSSGVSLHSFLFITPHPYETCLPFSFFATFQNFFFLHTFFLSSSPTDDCQHSVCFCSASFPQRQVYLISSPRFLSLTSAWHFSFSSPLLFFFYKLLPSFFFSKLRQIQSRCPPILPSRPPFSWH